MKWLAGITWAEKGKMNSPFHDLTLVRCDPSLLC